VRVAFDSRPQHNLLVEGLLIQIEWKHARMEVLHVGIYRPHKFMLAVHVECYVPRVAFEKLMWNVQPLFFIDQSIVPLGECRVVEGSVL
jgi:hypothetical protein